MNYLDKNRTSPVPEYMPAKVVKVDGHVVDTTCQFNDHGDRCGRRGIFSSGTTGLGPWYCRDHAWVFLGDGRTQQPLPKAEIGHEPITIEAKRDGVDWARRIMARLEAGEDVPMRGQQLAREALAMVVVIRQPGEDDE